LPPPPHDLVCLLQRLQSHRERRLQLRTPDVGNPGIEQAFQLPQTPAPDRAPDFQQIKHQKYNQEQAKAEDQG
jgi:hypothetical protein